MFLKSFSSIKTIKFSFRVTSRVLVTQDDPLGALNGLDTDETNNHKKAESDSKQLTNNNHINDTIYTDTPILFKGHRSATFEDSMQLSKNMHRSETMPNANSVTSSLANLGTSLKLNFG